MSDYIDRDALLARLRLYEPPLDFALKEVENAPAADVRPNVTGRWISVPHKLARICSICGQEEPYKFADTEASVYNFCPNCGADMREA